jgi:arylsulfate sulfotransferase
LLEDGFVLDVPDPLAPLQRTVRFRTDEPSSATWILASGEHRVSLGAPATRDHTTTFLGLRPDRVYLSTVELEGPSGRRTVRGPEVVTGALPEAFPRIDTLAWDPARTEPGFTLINLTVPLQDEDDVTFVVLLDDALEPVWFLQTGTVGYVRWDEGVWGIQGGIGVHWRADGTVDRRLMPSNAPGALEEGDVRLGVESQLHYDLLPTGDDSFWTITFDSFEVDEYPLSVEEPEVVPNPQTLRDVVVAELGFDGTLRRTRRLSERLDTGRITFTSLDPSPDGLDWAHSNAVNHNPEGGLLISSRHQDAVVALDEQGDVQWILSNPQGWSPPFEALRLQPVGDVAWPYHQHAPHWGDDGVLVMFDNGNQRYTPYNPPEVPPESYTRVVGFRVDSEAMTVEEAWSYVDTVTGPLYSQALGDADPQPLTGNVLATYSMLTEEAGVANVDAGMGDLVVRLIEFEPGSLQAVLDLRFSTDLDVHPRGVRSFRSDRVPVDQVPWQVSSSR